MDMAPAFEAEIIVGSNPTGEAKHCPRCLLDKPLDAFAWRVKSKGTRNSACKECQKEISQKHYRDKKQDYFDRNAKRQAEINRFVNEYKEASGCVDCKRQDLPHYALDMHHREPDGKTDIVSRLKLFGLKKVKIELEKCDVVCATCHRLRHPCFCCGG